MSTILYKAAETAVSVFGHKKIYSLGPRELESFLKEHNGAQNLEPPRFITRDFSVSKQTISDCLCWIIEPRGTESTRKDFNEAENSAALFLHGGGFIFGIHAIHWLAVAKIIKRLFIPVWVPLYPLVPQTTIERMSFIAADIYQQCEKKFPAKRITVLGDSAGAHLALVLCHHIGAKKITAPMPGKIILVSPGMFSEQDPRIVAAMKETEKHDKLLSYAIIDSLSALCDVDMSLDNYLYAPLYGNFSAYLKESGFPRVCVFSGTHDIFFPQIPPFVERLKKAGVSCEFERGEGMMHVWPYMPAVPESAAAFEKMCDFIARE